MATFVSNNGNYTTTLTVTEVNRNIVDNKTTLSYNIITVFNGSSGSWNNDVGARVVISLDKKTVHDKSYTYDFRSSNKRTWTSGTFIVTHDADGTKTIPVSFSVKDSSNSYLSETQTSSSMTLTSIPRASAISLNQTSTTFGSTVTINLDRKVSSYTHDIQYKFSSDSSWTNIATGVATSTTWTVPTSLVSKIPNSNSGTWNIRAVTKSGTNQIGTSQANLIVKLANNTELPSVDIAITPVSSTSNGTFAKGKSKATIKVISSAKSGATIKSTSTVVKLATQTITSSNLSTFTTNILGSAGTYTVTTSVTDSRGTSNSTSKTFVVNDYFNPKFTKFEAYRSDSAGVEDLGGAYIKIEAISKHSTISGNTGSLKVEYRELPNGSFTEAFSTSGLNSGNSKIIPASLEKEFEVKATVNDYFASFTQSKFIGTDAVLLDFHFSGTGIAINKVATLEKTIDIADNTRLVGGSVTPLLDKDLNEITKAGNYYQHKNVDATALKNYPVNFAGYLEVITSETHAFTMQRYTQYDTFSTWHRMKYGNTWFNWKMVYGLIDISDSILSSNPRGLQVSAWRSPDTIYLTLVGKPAKGRSELGKVSINPLMNVVSSVRYAGGFQAGKNAELILTKGGTLTAIATEEMTYDYTFTLVYPYRQ